MDKEFGTLVFIGRFQPFHYGHKHVIDEALKVAERVIVLVGSSDESRTQRNPWNFQERYTMIRYSLDYSQDEQKRVLIAELPDSKYNENAWIENVQRTVKTILYAHPVTKSQKIGITGYGKDNSSYYLKLFPQWDSYMVDPRGNKFQKVLGSTEIRKQYFDRNITDFSYMQFMPQDVVEQLHVFRSRSDYAYLADEFDYIKKYKKQWEVAPYPVTFVTVDSVVVQSGHVLLVSRREQPGKGKWALPGGFIGQDEQIVDAALRELKEETRIRIPQNVIKDKLVSSKVFDEPHRSARGRTITHAFLFHLEPNENLPVVKGSDDAQTAFWIPITDIKRENMFEDHYDIIQNMTSIL